MGAAKAALFLEIMILHFYSLQDVHAGQNVFVIHFYRD